MVERTLEQYFPGRGRNLLFHYLKKIVFHSVVLYKLQIVKVEIVFT